MRVPFVLAALLSITTGCAQSVELRGRDGAYGVISTTARAADSREVVIELFGGLVHRARALVAWARLAGPPLSTRRLGPLAHKPNSQVDDQGLLRATIPPTPCEVLITVEDSPEVDHPSADVVATAQLR